MLHSIHPVTSIFATVGVRVRSKAMLFIELVLAFVLTAVLPYISSVSVHYSTLELSDEVSSISPLETALATHLVLGPVARVLTAIGPEVYSVALFLAVLEMAQVVATIAPHLDALSVLFLRLVQLGVRLSAKSTLLVQIFLNIVLSEHTQVGLLVQLPDTLEYLILHRTEHSEA